METKGLRVAYIRVSTAEQNPARQYEAVGQVDRTFEDRISGKKAATERPALAEMLRYVREGDRVVVASFDRLARDLGELRRVVKSLTDEGVEVEFVKERLTFSGEDSPMANLLLNLLGAVAEFEVATIRERQREGIAAAKARGEYAGRGGRPKALTAAQVAEVRRRAQAGEHKAAIARDLGVSRSSVYRALVSDLPTAA